jgi:sugar/nucleoside kinase (ribokinase family)
VVSRAAADFDAEANLPGIRAVIGEAAATTRFVNEYTDGERRQRVVSQAEPLDLSLVPDDLRAPEVLLLAPVAGEIPAPMTQGFDARLVGAVAQGWLRDIGPDGGVSPRHWASAGRDLAGVDVAFVSERDLPGGAAEARELLRHVPLVMVTLGRRGADLLTREGETRCPTLPRDEIDPTGAGDVFAAAFLLRYHECGEPVEAAAFAGCAASCVVEGEGTSTLGERRDVLRRLAQLKRSTGDGDQQ